jgi:C1A family cysteine protease
MPTTRRPTSAPPQGMPFTRFGTHPDVPDVRDLEFVAPARLRHATPRSVDLRARCPPVFDQGTVLNSCSAQAIAAAMWFLERRHARDAPAPSRLFLYYNERARAGLTGSNAPVSLRDGYKSVARQGICTESLWPYQDDRFAVKPPPACYRAALAHRAIRYFRLRRELGDFRRCLAVGYPFAIGISVYESFIGKAVARSGIVPLPRARERHLGGHAMLVVGYDDKAREFIVRNSAGPRWGRHGYCVMPYAYVLNVQLAWDFWMVRRQGR